LSLSAYERGYKFGQRFRNTVFLSIFAWSIGAGATFWWHPEVFAFLQVPAGGMLSPFEGGLPIITAPQDGFGATIGLSMKGGQVAAFPVLAVGLLSMLKPFVPKRFWLFVVVYSALMLTMFVGAQVFVYYVMMPVSLKFLLTFGAGIVIPVIILSEYMALLLALLFWMGVAFQLPIVMNLLAKFRLVKYPRAKTLRKWVPWVALIFSALITPSLDGTLTLMVAAPILLLYEFGLFFGWLEHPREGNYLSELLDDIVKFATYTLSLVANMIFGVIMGVFGVVRQPVLPLVWWLRKHGLVS
jgi:sec-independent protein translocase protein TatC